VTPPAQAQNADAAWRDPLHVVTGWQEAVDPRLLRHRVRGPFWDLLDGAGVSLLVTREYEHVVVALQGAGGRGRVTHLAVPHPSGVAFDERRGMVHLASTRNPNQVIDLAPVEDGPLIPMGSRTLPGRLYLHDLAMVAGRLHANAVGENSVVRLPDGGGADRVWAPRVVADHPEGFQRNHLQLNSIAAGRTLATSYFTASADDIGRRKPGQRNFPVDGRGVVFSGRTRAPVARGLTRPHSARLSPVDGRLFVANSGYGELVTVTPADGTVAVVAELPGWTRGLALHGDFAFVGTSRVLPRFEGYAPGLDPASCVCGVHVVDLRTGDVVASLRWPAGDQLFAVEALPQEFADGLPAGPRRGAARQRALFYDFQVKAPGP
jgi:uncharacterized protein (TIGR03032 family)